MAPGRARGYLRDMAEVVYLSDDQSPPSDGGWLLLTKGEDGLFGSRSQHRIGEVMRHDHHSDRWPLNEAIARAQKDAVAFPDIATIYVKGAHAQGS